MLAGVRLDSVLTLKDHISVNVAMAVDQHLAVLKDTLAVHKITAGHCPISEQSD